MTIRSSGALPASEINTELGVASNTQISIGGAVPRGLAGVASGAIRLAADYYGKSGSVAVSYAFTANTANASLNVTTISGYSAGKSNITITVNSGVYLYGNYSTQTIGGAAGLTLTGGQAGDTIRLVNNGFIMGQGGRGSTVQSTALAGATALKLGFNTTIDNTNTSAYIGGGGGGGGNWAPSQVGGGGGGAGGGAGNGANCQYSGAGGAGGSPGSVGSNGTLSGVPGSSAQPGQGGGSGGGGGGMGFGNASQTNGAGGGGGGRIFPGTGGTAGTATGNGGRAWSGGAGGSGSGAGAAAGGSGSNGGGGGGGGWGASGGGPGSGNASAGAGGKAVDLNGYTVTWVSSNTTRVYGSVA